MKVTTMVQEILRRWKRTSENLSKEVFETITKEFMDNLRAMGYGTDWRKNVLKSALKGYRNLLTDRSKGRTERNRWGHTTFTKRRAMKLSGAASWFQLEKEENSREHPGRKGRGRKKEKENPEAVMFVPHTPGGILRKKLQGINEVGKGCKVRYIENVGPTMKDLLVVTKPWGTGCNREDCFLCRTGGKGDCMTQGVTYRIDCLSCKEEQGRTVTYFGESARTCYDRGGEHWRAWKKGQKESVLTIH